MANEAQLRSAQRRISLERLDGGFFKCLSHLKNGRMQIIDDELLFSCQTVSLNIAMAVWVEQTVKLI